VGAGFFVLPDVPAGQQRGPVGAALRRRGESIGEQNALARNAIECRRVDRFAAGGARVRPRLIVRDGQQDVRAAPLEPGHSRERRRRQRCRSRHDAQGTASRILQEFPPV